MMWSDKAFMIYMGEAGFVTPVDAIVDEVTPLDVRHDRVDAGTTDPCADGDTQRRSWVTRAGRSLTDTQVYRAARG